ncbi:MAG: hypothetical protein QXM68_02120 [Candidatus Aenigmatarchaeota archaeon]|nr:hypothetical protein [Candidatus Aenigmarchaeota archaeon]
MMGRYCLSCKKWIDSRLLRKHIMQGHTISWDKIKTDNKCDERYDTLLDMIRCFYEK